MPEFLLVGRRGKSSRVREWTIRAADEGTARRQIESSGTIITSVERLPGPPASPEMISQGEKLGLAFSDAPERLEVVQAMIVYCMHENHRLEIQLGTAMNEAMEDVPWRARIRPIKFQNSIQGLRIRCEAQAIGSYMIVGDGQLEGTRLILLDDIEDARIV